MRAVRRAGRGAGRWIVLVTCFAVALAATGLLYAGVTRHDPRASIASALFIGGSVLVVASALAGSGREGEGRAWSASSDVASALPFAWVLAGSSVIAAGALALSL